MVCLTINVNAQSLNANTAGNFHNVQMDKYYEKLKKLTEKKAKDEITQADFKLLFKELLISVYGDKNELIINESLEEFDSYYGKNGLEIADLALTKLKRAEYGSDNLKTFLIEIIDDTKSLQIEDAENYFTNKINEAKNKFKDKDLEIVLGSLNTGRASFNYWSENYSKWHLLFNNSSTLLQRGPRPGKVIAAADCAGFVGGACWGAMGGTAFLPGVGTVTGALAVGTANGMYASCVAGLGSAFMSLFGG